MHIERSAAPRDAFEENRPRENMVGEQGPAGLGYDMI